MTKCSASSKGAGRAGTNATARFSLDAFSGSFISYAQSTRVVPVPMSSLAAAGGASSSTHQSPPMDELAQQQEEEEEEEEEEDEGQQNLDLGPIVPLKQQLDMDKDDESLQRWKEQLLGSSSGCANPATGPEPEVQLQALCIISPDRPEVRLPVPFRGHAFTLKEGCCYRLRFTFTVRNNIVSGLTYMNTVWKTGLKVDRTRRMLGTYAPRPEPYDYVTEEETTPSGFFARGSYTARTKFVDDDKRCYLELDYSFDIRRDWH